MSTSAADAATEMKAVAEAWAAGRPKLDFSLASLEPLQELVKAERRAGLDVDVAAAGAYLGETLVRNGGGRVAWIDFETAARTNLTIAALLGTFVDRAVLRVDGRGHQLPAREVEWFLAHAKRDTLTGFADFVLKPPPIPPTMPTPPPTPPVPIADLLAALSQAATGRGYKRVDPGMDAAREIADRLAAGSEPRDPTVSLLEQRLDDPSKQLRTNAAFAVAAQYLRERRHDEVTVLARRGDASIDSGVFEALKYRVHYWFDKSFRDLTDTPPPDIKPYLPLFEIGLASKGAVIATVLTAVYWWDGDRADLLPTVRRLLHDPRPAVVEAAARILYEICYDVAHGRSKFDPLLAACIPRLAELTLAKPGAQKILKTQKAAGSALGAFQEIRAHLDPDTAALLERANAAARDLR